MNFRKGGPHLGIGIELMSNCGEPYLSTFSQIWFWGFGLLPILACDRSEIRIRPLPEGGLFRFVLFSFFSVSLFLVSQVDPDLFLYFCRAYLVGYLAAWEGPQLLLEKVKNASGRIGIFTLWLLRVILSKLSCSQIIHLTVPLLKFKFKKILKDGEYFLLRVCWYLYRHRQYRHIGTFSQYRHIGYRQTSLVPILPIFEYRHLENYRQLVHVISHMKSSQMKIS